jgi:hypothetical protein
MTRDQLSVVLDRFEQWIKETIDYHGSDNEYATSFAMGEAREELFSALVIGLEVDE